MATGVTGVVGGLETMGEIVLTNPAEEAHLKEGFIDYFKFEAALESVHAPLDVL